MSVLFASVKVKSSDGRSSIAVMRAGHDEAVAQWWFPARSRWSLLTPSLHVSPFFFLTKTRMRLLADLPL